MEAAKQGGVICGQARCERKGRRCGKRICAPCYCDVELEGGVVGAHRCKSAWDDAKRSLVRRRCGRLSAMG